MAAFKVVSLVLVVSSAALAQNGGGYGAGLLSVSAGLNGGGQGFGGQGYGGNQGFRGNQGLGGQGYGVNEGFGGNQGFGGHQGFGGNQGLGGQGFGGQEDGDEGQNGGGYGGHHQEYYHHPSYKFSYGVKDPHTKDIKSQSEHRDGDKTEGEYSLVEPDGTTRTVKYHVHGKSGFIASVHRSGHAVHPQTVHHGGHQGSYGGQYGGSY